MPRSTRHGFDVVLRQAVDEAQTDTDCEYGPMLSKLVGVRNQPVGPRSYARHIVRTSCARQRQQAAPGGGRLRRGHGLQLVSAVPGDGVGDTSRQIKGLPSGREDSAAV
jgi:hypothetical protein